MSGHLLSDRKKHGLEIVENGEVRIEIFCNSSRNMSKKEVSNKNIGPMNNKNKQRNSSSLSFLRVKLRFILKITTKNVLKSICNDNHQNSANFVNFYRIVIFSGCPGEVGRTDKISVLPFFEKFEFSEVTKRYGGP